MNDENGDLLADSHNILNRWKNYFSRLLNVHNISDVRHTEVHAAGPSRLGDEIANAKFKKYKSPDSNEIPAELIQPGGETSHGLRSKNSLILFGIRKNCLISGKSLLLYQFTKRAMKLTVLIIVGYHCYQRHTKFYRISSSQG
jgi:hypothetical protein